jgi:hypothetical protein
MMNENAIANILVDVKFLEDQFRDAGRANLVPLFAELRSVRPSTRRRKPLFQLILFFIRNNSHPCADNINRVVRFGGRIPRAITTPNDVRTRQTEKAHRIAREASTLWRKLPGPNITREGRETAQGGRCSGKAISRGESLRDYILFDWPRATVGTVVSIDE